ncbi:sentrin-specific protease 2-like [Metopolophium dirhodum]|uniref:sentrin-specific protease 2-like n=1 Tax=Metopolophium dirhodum TaxID=44670 RepID=UPI00298FEF9A|nr:sentrin-specific protease 2-like [Metopolophium dirhodum]
MAPPTHWYLNDNVINDYFNLIKKQNPSVYSFDTYFYERLKKSGYNFIERWTKRVNIFSKRKVFFPINIKANNFAHWVLVMADMEDQQVVYYDSLSNHHNFEIHSDILEYLGLEHRRKLGTPLPFEDWKLVKADNPIQSNGKDCGVFVCTFAEYLSRDAVFNFSQKHMLSFRKLIAYELSTQQLINIHVEENHIDEEIDRITNNFLINKLI